MSKVDYQRDVSIDVAHFDLEWLRQADLALRYGEELAEARAKMDRAKEAMQVEEAKAQFRVRTKYEGGKQPTVDQIKAETLLDITYTKAREALAMCEHNFGLVRAAYDAIVMKKSTMENYLKGQLAGLWGQPIEPRQEGESYGQKAVESTRSQATEASREAASRRRTRTA